MTRGVNKVILIGNPAADPVVRSFQSGGRDCEFHMATSEIWKDRTSGERKERTQWHNIAIYTDGLAEVAEKYLSKGSTVSVEGQLEYRTYQDHSGNDKYWTEVALRGPRSKLVLAGQRDGSAGGDDYGYGVRRDEDVVTSDPGPGYGPSGFDDDEIPF